MLVTVTARRGHGQVPDALPLWRQCRLALPELPAGPLHQRRGGHELDNQEPGKTAEPWVPSACHVSHLSRVTRGVWPGVRRAARPSTQSPPLAPPQRSRAAGPLLI